MGRRAFVCALDKTSNLFLAKVKKKKKKKKKNDTNISMFRSISICSSKWASWTVLLRTRSSGWLCGLSSIVLFERWCAKKFGNYFFNN